MDLWKSITGSIYGAVPSDNRLSKDLVSKIEASKKLNIDLEVAYRNLKAYIDALSVLASTTVPVVNDMIQLAHVGEEQQPQKVIEAAESLRTTLNRDILKTLNSSMTAIDMWRKSIIDLDIKLEEQKKMELELYTMRGRLVTVPSPSTRRELQQQIELAESKLQGVAKASQSSFVDLVSSSGHRGGNILTNFAFSQRILAKKGLVLSSAATELSAVAEKGRITQEIETQDRSAGTTKKQRKREQKKTNRKKDRGEDSSSSSRPESSGEGREGEQPIPIDLLDFEKAFEDSTEMSPKFGAFQGFDPFDGEAQSEDANNSVASVPVPVFREDPSLREEMPSELSKRYGKSDPNAFAHLDPFHSHDLP
jgi:hypothetical protein